MFRFKSGVNVDYDKQGYIHFASRRYKKMPPKMKEKILNLCLEAGGEYYQALFAYVTTDATATEISMQYFLSKATLYRVVKTYYESFPDWL